MLNPFKRIREQQVEIEQLLERNQKLSVSLESSKAATNELMEYFAMDIEIIDLHEDGDFSDYVYAYELAPKHTSSGSLNAFGRMLTAVYEKNTGAKPPKVGTLRKYPKCMKPLWSVYSSNS